MLVLLAVYSHTDHFFKNQYDDTYITYRYAINLAEGHGLVFNIGEHTDAASSFLYTIILAAFWLLRIHNLEFVGAAIGVLSLGLITLYVYKLALFLSKNQTAALTVAVIAGLNGFLAGWALSGMETLPWAAIVIVAIYLITVDANSYLIALAIAAASLMRVEGLLLVLPYCILILRNGRPAKDISLVAAIIVGLGIFYIAKHAYYGVWISHAFEMKKVASYYQPSPKELFHYWVIFASIPVLLSLYALRNWTQLPAWAYVAISLAAILMGPKSDWSRYSVHLLPIFYCFAAMPLAALLTSKEDLVLYFDDSSCDPGSARSNIQLSKHDRSIKPPDLQKRTGKLFIRKRT